MTIRSLRRGTGLVAFCAVLAVSGWVLAHPYAVPDWFRLREYQPPSTISSIADETTMTGTARHLFYINRPQVEDKATFAQACPQADEQTIVIGCYLGGQRGIHVLMVDDQRLAGIEQVTAAHEMLHAAYDRLGRVERNHVDAMLQNYADNGLKDERIKNILRSYLKSEPGQQYNEMHSIFGTEIKDLPDDLSAYYARYFDDRQKVVAYAEHYQEAFTSRQAAVKNYDDQLAALGAVIKQDTDNLEKQDKQLTAMRQELEGYRSRGDIATYNNKVDPFNQKIDQYNSLLNQTKALIDKYNAMVNQRNAIADQTAELQQAISSSSLPASK